MTGQSNNSQGRGHDRLPNWNPKNGGMLISQPVTSCLTNHSELCISRPRNNQSRRISIYRFQRRPSFGFESSVSSTSMTRSGDPVNTSRNKGSNPMMHGSSAVTWPSQARLLWSRDDIKVVCVIALTFVKQLTMAYTVQNHCHLVTKTYFIRNLPVFIKPHRTAHADAVYCYIPSSVVCRSVGLSQSKMAEPIEMPFGLRTPVGPRNHLY